MRVELKDSMRWEDYTHFPMGMELDINLNEPAFFSTNGRAMVICGEHLIPASFFDVLPNQDTKDFSFLTDLIDKMDSHIGVLVVNQVDCPMGTWPKGECYYFFDEESIESAYYNIGAQEKGTRNLLAGLAKRALAECRAETYEIRESSFGNIELLNTKTRERELYGSVEAAIEGFQDIMFDKWIESL